jgi:hypothetical protein
MRARRFTCALIVLLSGGEQVAWGSDADTLAADAARYYANGLQAPLLQIRTGAVIVETCKKRLRSSCSKRHRLAADKAPYTIEYLDALTLFPRRLTSDPSATLRKYADVVGALDAVNAEVIRAARDYDRALFDRYRATLQACPPENLAQYHESLDALEQLDVRAFGAAAPSSVENSPPATTDACAAARDFGELLMTMMSAKLEPWRRGADALPDPEATRSIANQFLFEVATELQVTVDPDSRSTFDAIAQRLHDSEPRAPKKPGLTLSW